MLLRGVLGRLAVDLPKTSARDLPQLAHLVHRTLGARNGLSLPVARALSRVYQSSFAESRRAYATTRATKTTGTVKKAAPKKSVPKKKTAAKKTATKKPKKKTVKKASTTKPKKRVKKELTAEEKETTTIRDLKKKALKEPVSHRALTAYNIFAGEIAQGTKNLEQAQSAITAASSKWHALTPAEREHYNISAKEATEARRVEYDAWVRSHTPDEIRIANLARATLRTKASAKGLKSMPAQTAKIVDPRQLKRPLPPVLRYYTERYATGDFKGIATAEASKLSASEWKELSQSEKKKYEDEYQADVEKYRREYEQVYGRKTRAGSS